MPYNPNVKLPGMMPMPPQPHMNRNPSGFGGMLGGFQPQSPYPDATMNSTQYSPQQYSDIGGPATANSLQPTYENTLALQNQQNQILGQQLGTVQGFSSLQNQILAYARMLEEQARRARPTSGAYYFIGGL